MSVRVSKSKKWGFLEVDIRVRLPDGTRHRERTKSPVQSRSGAKRWAEERERYLALHGKAQRQKEVPTLEEFSKRFIEDYAKANKLKASGIAAKQTVLEKHLVPVLGKKRLNEIGDYEVQKVKRHLTAMKLSCSSRARRDCAAGRSSRWSARTSTSSATRSRCGNPTGKGRSTRRRAARRDACR
jgi:hypothetical protein